MRRSGSEADAAKHPQQDIAVDVSPLVSSHRAAVISTDATGEDADVHGEDQRCGYETKTHRRRLKGASHCRSGGRCRS